MRHSPIGLLGLALLARVAGAQVEYYTLSTLPTTNFGLAVAAVGDLDGDGVDDVGVGEPMGPVTFGPGAVHFYSGDGGAPLFTVVAGGTGSLFGAALAPAGDIDDDGFPDVIIGAYADAHEGTAAGRAFVHSGRNGALLLTLDGSGPQQWLGLSVASLGDVDLDGVPDLAAGAPGHVFGAPKPGRVAIYSGADAALLHDVPGQAPGDDFGWTLAAPGDLGGDGVPDLAVGALGEVPGPGAGRVTLVNGASGAIKVLTPAVATPDFGLGLLAFDDLDGDGVSEVAVGSPLTTATGFHSGAVFLYSGRTGALHSVLRGAPLESFGQTLARVPDVTGDGRDELLVGAPAWPITQQFPGGRVAVVDPVTGHRLAQVDGTVAGGAFGHALACLGDTNDDGLPEIAVAGEDDVVVLGAP